MRAAGRAALILRGWTHAGRKLTTLTLSRRAKIDQDDAVPMRGERCSQGEACHFGFDLRARVSVVGIAKFNAKSTAG